VVEDVDDDDLVSQPASAPELPPPLNKFSKAETFWILAGLWSAVFLGALDGAYF
jgi:hypothetical protein